MADRFRSYGRCVVVIDARVHSLYGESMQTYFTHHSMGLKVLPLGIDEEQKSLKTVEEVMVFFADVGLMRRETPLLMGGGLITDICGTACNGGKIALTVIVSALIILGVANWAWKKYFSNKKEVSQQK